MRKKLLILSALAVISFTSLSFFNDLQIVNAQTSGTPATTSMIQGRRIDMDEDNSTPAFPADGVETTITVKEAGPNGATIGSYVVKTSKYITQIDNVEVRNTYASPNTLTPGGQYIVSIEPPITGYKVFYSVNMNAIRHQDGGDNDVYISPGGVDVYCTGESTDPVYCYHEGSSATITMPTVLAKNNDGTDYVTAYADVYWKYMPIKDDPPVPTDPDSYLSHPITPTAPAPTPTLNPDCMMLPKGDADCDEDVDYIDYQIWRCEFLNNGICTDTTILPAGITATNKWANFNFQKFNTVVDLVDFEIWRKNTGVYPTGAPSPTPTDNPNATPTITPTTPIISSTPVPTIALSHRLLYVSNRSGDNNDIYVMRTNKTEYKLVDSNFQDTEPSVSANGSRIVFSSFRDGNQEIYVTTTGANAAETRLTTSVATNEFKIDAVPAISPDGTKVVFTSNRERNNYDLYLVDITNLNAIPAPQRLTTNIRVDTQPSFSPDGTKIIFTSYRHQYEGGGAEIYMLDLTAPATGSNPYNQTRITNNVANDIWPSFHPDFATNQRIIFTSNRPRIRLFSMKIDGTGFTPLNNNNLGYADVRGSYSPDGQHIIFQSNRSTLTTNVASGTASTTNSTEGDNEIYIMNADGTNVQQVSSNAFDDNYPSFIPNDPIVPTNTPTPTASISPTPVVCGGVTCDSGFICYGGTATGACYMPCGSTGQTCPAGYSCRYNSCERNP